MSVYASIDIEPETWIHSEKRPDGVTVTIGEQGEMSRLFLHLADPKSAERLIDAIRNPGMRRPVNVA